ncbi:MAG: RNA 2'-phosphotransferase [Desulfobacterales bacterium]|nr:RNA 2'-phosphotransferase [Desulfobacterales bacterium]
MTARHHAIAKFSKFAAYVLGRQPDEFGLVPDADGFVKIKELCKAIGEEQEWRHIREKHINEILTTLPDPPLEIKDTLIRAKCRDKLFQPRPADHPPKLLYTCVKNKAYPFVLQNGIQPTSRSTVVLSSEPDMAERIGRRDGAHPVLLTVSVQKTLDQSIGFLQAGNRIYLAPSIPAGCFTGPPAAKQKTGEKPKNLPAQDSRQRLPGSFILNLPSETGPAKKQAYKTGKKDIPWKKERKQKRKQKMWSP